MLTTPHPMQDLAASANVNVGNAGMPTFINFFRNYAVDALTALRLIPGARQHLSILGGVKGVLKPVSYSNPVLEMLLKHQGKRFPPL